MLVGVACTEQLLIYPDGTYWENERHAARYSQPRNVEILPRQAVACVSRDSRLAAVEAILSSQCYPSR